MRINHSGKLVVGLDQVAWLRESRKSAEPDPVEFGLQAERFGAQGLKVHFRMDRRHIQDRDVELVARLCKTHFFLQLSPNQDVVHLVNQLRPQNLIICAERRDELATETGLDISLLGSQLLQLFRNLDASSTRIYIMVDPEFEQIRTAAKLEIHGVVLNVREWALGGLNALSDKKYSQLVDAVKLSSKYGLETHLSNGISLDLIPTLAGIPGVDAIHVGHDLVSRALLLGVKDAISDFSKALRQPIHSGK